MMLNRDMMVPAPGRLPAEMRAEPTAAQVGRPRLLCREIADRDLDDVIALLHRGFPGRAVEVWRRGLAHHAAHPHPEGCPKWGYVLTADGRMVGVILMLCAPPGLPGIAGPRCNMASWYVEPAYRLYATLLDKLAMRNREITFTNISAAGHTVPMHLARGFSRSSSGQYASFPLLARRRPAHIVTTIDAAGALDRLAEPDRRTLVDHAGYGCICLVGSDGRTAAPFVFVRHPVRYLRWRLGFSPIHYLQVVYCRSTEDLVAYARPLGAYLLRHHAAACVLIDADGPIPGLPGLYRSGMEARLKRGPRPVMHGDLRYSELAIFGP